MDDLPDLIDSYDRLVAAAVEATAPSAVERAASIGKRVRARRGYLGSTVVVALAGGTGTGKSSTVNALAGEDVAVSSSRRPTTARPMAWIPSNPEPGLVRLLDDLGIDERVGHTSHEDLAMIDLPDIDSVEFDHRMIVERLLPEVDAVIWVVDPEKYQDRILHREHLAQLTEYQDQFLFVMNQIDRIPEGELDRVLEDLRGTLHSDGISDPVIIVTAADPTIGPPQGIGDLEQALHGLGDAKSIVQRKLITDLERGALELAEAAGISTAGGTGFAQRWKEVVDAASGRIADDVLHTSVASAAMRQGQVMARSAVGLAPGRTHRAEVPLGEPGAGVVTATQRIDGLVTDLAEQIGGEVAAELRAIGMIVDEEIADVAQTLRFGTTLTLAEPPAWTAAVAWVRRFVVIGLVLSLIWLYQTIRAGQDLTPPTAAVLLSIVLLTIPLVFAGASGRRWGRAAVEAQRHTIMSNAGREIDRRLGKPLRESLRKRAGAAAAFADFELSMRTAASRSS